MRMWLGGVVVWALLGCVNRTEQPDGGDSDVDSDGDVEPTIEQICETRDDCVEAADPHAGPCLDTLGVLGDSTDEACIPCLRCLLSATCADWRESPNGPLACENSCALCEIAWDGDEGSFWDECATDADCAYAHFCVGDPGFCQRVCDAGVQCNLAICGEDRLCWLVCGDTRCDPKVECFEVIHIEGHVVSACGGGG